MHEGFLGGVWFYSIQINLLYVKWISMTCITPTNFLYDLKIPLVHMQAILA